MGVRFYGKENMSTGDDYTTTTRASCSCNACSQHTRSTATSTIATQTCSSSYNSNNLNFQKSGILREIIGNCKEVRIEENAHNLRIVGNNNRIRITLNVGDITIIGNNSRLKIKINHGHIKYTGNDGRICLGRESTEQLVDYSGCNGVLKVQNSKKFSEVNGDADDATKTAAGNTSINGKFKNSKNPKEKYSSYSGSRSDSEVFKCNTDYSNIFNRKKSMPNMPTKTQHNHTLRSNQRAQQLPKSIAHNFSNIVIANSANVCITPYSYTY